MIMNAVSNLKTIEDKIIYFIKKCKCLLYILIFIINTFLCDSHSQRSENLNNKIFPFYSNCIT